MNLENTKKVLAFPNSRSSQKRRKFLQKVDRWMSDRYSTALEYARLHDIEEHGLDDSSFSMLSVKEYLVRQEKIFLPVKTEGLLTGCLVLSPQKGFKKESLESILQLVNGIVCPFIEQIERDERAKIDLQRLEGDRSSEAISLFPQRTEFRAEVEDLEPIYIEGKSSFEIRKRAMDIHDQRDTLFFLPFDQIDADKREVSKELKSLGRTTIFVHDMSQFERKELGAVLDLIRNNSPFDRDRPLFVLGSTVDFVDIERILKLSSLEARLILNHSIYLNQ